MSLLPVVVCEEPVKREHQFRRLRFGFIENKTYGLGHRDPLRDDLPTIETRLSLWKEIGDAEFQLSVRPAVGSCDKTVPGINPEVMAKWMLMVRFSFAYLKGCCRYCPLR